MPVVTNWTMKRLENVVRLRQYKETYHYEGEDGMTDSIVCAREYIIALRDLPEFLVEHGIEMFDVEENMEMLVKVFV